MQEERITYILEKLDRQGRVLVSEIIGVFRVGGHSLHPVGKHFF